MNTLLLVDDETAILQMLGDFLKSEYRIRRAINGKTALNFIKQDTPDIIVLDWMLPDISGPDIVAWVRNHELYKDIPIIMLSAKGTEADKIKGFDVGVDDYVVKPFLLSELRARIKVLLRRNAANAAKIIRIGDLSIHLESDEFFIKNTQVKLTKQEFILLKLLMQSPKRTYSRAQLIALVWKNTIEIDSRAVDVCISRLRKSLEDHHCDGLKTIHGIGYQLALDDTLVYE